MGAISLDYNRWLTVYSEKVIFAICPPLPSRWVLMTHRNKYLNVEKLRHPSLTEEELIDTE